MRSPTRLWKSQLALKAIAHCIRSGLAPGLAYASSESLLANSTRFFFSYLINRHSLQPSVGGYGDLIDRLATSCQLDDLVSLLV